jgi:DNA primase
VTPRGVAAFVPWSLVLEEVHVNPGRKGRTSCVIHRGSNRTAFSFSEITGYGHCFNCGWSGDKLALLQSALNIDFKTALARLAVLAGVQLDDYRKPNGAELRHLQTDKVALAVTRSRYEQWCHDRWQLLCEFNDVALKKKSDAELVLRLNQKYPGELSVDEIEKWERQLRDAEAEIESLEWELDIFHYRQHEALRFAMWSREMEACSEL